VAAILAEVLLGTFLTFAGLPGFAPLPWGQILAVFGYAMVACLGLNELVKVRMIRWRVPEAVGQTATIFA
jgi:hypothetical protein